MARTQWMSSSSRSAEMHGATSRRCISHLDGNGNEEGSSDDRRAERERSHGMALQRVQGRFPLRREPARPLPRVHQRVDHRRAEMRWYKTMFWWKNEWSIRARFARWKWRREAAKRRRRRKFKHQGQ